MRAFALALAAVLVAGTFPASAQSRNETRAPRIEARERAAPVQRPDERISDPRVDRPRAGEFRIGVGHGIGFLPLYLAQDLKLFDKHAKALGFGGRVQIRRFHSAPPLHQALEKGELAAGALGLATFLRTRETAKPMVAISGLTTLPMVLLTARSDIASLSDIKPGQKIAVPMAAAPQVAMLRQHAGQWFSAGLWARLRQQLVVMPHQDALDALTSGKSEIAAYFASPPFTQVAMRDARVKPILSSAEAQGGKASFLVLAAPRETLKAQPLLAQVVAEAVDEASAIIARNPRQAALTWLKYEPSHTLDARAVEAVLQDIKDEFGSGVYGVTNTAALLAREGRLKSGVSNWKDVVAPVLATGPGS